MATTRVLRNVESRLPADSADAGIAAVRVLGVRMHAMTHGDIIRTIIRAAESGTRVVIANHNLHSLYFWPRDPQLQAFYSAADYVQIDGMPVVLLGKLFGCRLRREHRTANLDLLPDIASQATLRGWRLFYLGSRPGVAERGAQLLRKRYPALQIATHHGHFDVGTNCSENDVVVDAIRAYAPHILMVGMGMPRQELWIHDNLTGLTANVILCCGALMDLIAGEIPTAPRWLGPLGMEWLFRLVTQPKRTWRRYLLEPWSIGYRVGVNYYRSGHIALTTGSCDMTMKSLIGFGVPDTTASARESPETVSRTHAQ